MNAVCSEGPGRKEEERKRNAKRRVHDKRREESVKAREKERERREYKSENSYKVINLDRKNERKRERDGRNKLLKERGQK